MTVIVSRPAGPRCDVRRSVPIADGDHSGTEPFPPCQFSVVRQRFTPTIIPLRNARCPGGRGPGVECSEDLRAILWNPSTRRAADRASVPWVTNGRVELSQLLVEAGDGVPLNCEPHSPCPRQLGGWV
jgi:hypothetical protein